MASAFACLYRFHRDGPARRHLVRCLDLTRESDIAAFNELAISAPLIEIDADMYAFPVPNAMTKCNRPVEFTVPLEVHETGVYTLDESNVKANQVPLREFLASTGHKEHFYSVVDSLRAACRDLFGVFPHSGVYRLVFQVDKLFQGLEVCDLRRSRS